MWEIFTTGKQPYHGHKLQEVIKMVRGGHRLAKPEACTDDIWAIIDSCWVKQPNRRPTFRQLKKALAHVADTVGGQDGIRHIGELLNRDLDEDIKRATLTRKRPSNAQ